MGLVGASIDPRTKRLDVWHDKKRDKCGRVLFLAIFNTSLTGNAVKNMVDVINMAQIVKKCCI